MVMTRSQAKHLPADYADRERERLRSDAEHNRDRILAVARDALGASRDASLNSIAKKAGVGPGTLYRHFPSREALFLAVYQDDVRALRDSAADLLAQHAPIQALRLWLECLVTYGMASNSQAEALQSALTAGAVDGTCAQMSAAAARLLSACHQDGSVGPGVEPDEILLLLGFVWRIEPGPNAPARVARLLDVILAGLQAGAPRSTLRHRSRRARRSLRLPRRPSLVSLGAPRSL
jgi:AcrR family transcriptional regulator